MNKFLIEKTLDANDERSVVVVVSIAGNSSVSYQGTLNRDRLLDDNQYLYTVTPTLGSWAIIFSLTDIKRIDDGKTITIRLWKNSIIDQIKKRIGWN